MSQLNMFNIVKHENWWWSGVVKDIEDNQLTIPRFIRRIKTEKMSQQDDKQIELLLPRIENLSVVN